MPPIPLDRCKESNCSTSVLTYVWLVFMCVAFSMTLAIFACGCCGRKKKEKKEQVKVEQNAAMSPVSQKSERKKSRKKTTEVLTASFISRDMEAPKLPAAPDRVPPDMLLEDKTAVSRMDPAYQTMRGVVDPFTSSFVLSTITASKRVQVSVKKESQPAITAIQPDHQDVQKQPKQPQPVFATMPQKQFVEISTAVHADLGSVIDEGDTLEVRSMTNATRPTLQTKGKRGEPHPQMGKVKNAEKLPVAAPATKADKPKSKGSPVPEK